MERRGEEANIGAKKDEGGRKRGPRADADDLKQTILDAALAEFSERGFQGATMRRIADRAGVAPRLVHYYFGSKSDLGRACFENAFAQSSLFDMLAAGLHEGETIGEQYARTALALIEDPATGPAFLSMLRSVGTHEETREMLVSALTNLFALIGGVDAESDEARLRLSLMGSQIIGMAFIRYIVGFGPVAELETDELARIVGPTLDRYLTGDLS